MSETMTQDLFDIDLIETAIQDVSPEGEAVVFTAWESCGRTCTTCALC